MFRRVLPSLVAIVLVSVPAAALAHGGNPNFLSRVTALAPATPGVEVSVLNRDDRLQLVNRSGQDVMVLGYEEEPYARIKADGTVEVNQNSQALYLNEDRLGRSAGPAGLTKDSPVRWKPLSGTGRFEWHDHRMHWMSESRPPQVEDENAETHIFDWKVPVTIGGAEGQIAGTLDWVPLPGGGLPTGLIRGSAAALILLCAGVFVLRRRRNAGAGGEPAEAW